MNLKPDAHIHFMGICGVAMASLAGLLKQTGYKISGSDQNVYPPMSTQLEELGIRIMQGYKRENLTPAPDLVVVGNVITRKFEETQALLESEIKYTSLPKAMSDFVIQDRHSIVVAGTHGKTTTTSMMAWVAQCCGVGAGYLVGGIPGNFERSFQKPEGNYFIIEGDEYDTAFFDKVPKFIHYKPRSVILTSIEFDHADIYKNLDDVKKSFIQLLKLIPEDGLLVYNGDDQNILDILPYCQCRRQLSYGKGENCNYRVDHFEINEKNSSFSIMQGSKETARTGISMFAEYNALNATAAYLVAFELGWDRETGLSALASFKGVKRRQEVIGEPNGVKVIEDFAHHPTAVKETIKAVQKRFPDGQVYSVFEPRSATSRRRIFQQAYVDALKVAEHLVLAPAFDQSKIPEAERLSVTELNDALDAAGCEVHQMEDIPHIVEFVSGHVKPGDVVLLMSNGGFGGVYKMLIEAIEKQQ